MPFTTKEILTEIRREIWYRKRKYPAWMENNPENAPKLERQLAIMEEVERIFRARLEAEKPQLRMDL